MHSLQSTQRKIKLTKNKTKQNTDLKVSQDEANNPIGVFASIYKRTITIRQLCLRHIINTLIKYIVAGIKVVWFAYSHNGKYTLDLCVLIFIIFSPNTHITHKIKGLALRKPGVDSPVAWQLYQGRLSHRTRTWRRYLGLDAVGQRSSPANSGGGKNETGCHLRCNHSMPLLLL